MKLSHSKLSTILSCPMTYYLSYEQGITKKIEKSALAIGSAVHWGIEHNTDDLTEYYKQNGDFKSQTNFTSDQLLSEAMVYGYLKHKDNLFNQILTDPVTNEKLNLVDESHELYINADLDSFRFQTPHEFVGIVDLLLLTNKGFIVIDYKTSSGIPNWENYLDQIYRYIFLLKKNFPDVPIVKVGIVNIRKTAIRQKKTENEQQFYNRLKFEYDVNDENYVNYHEYPMETLSQTAIKDYIKNLSVMADTAETIVDSKNFYINYNAANNQYGKSDYWDIFYKTPDAYLLYKIQDKIWDDNNFEMVTSRDCVPLDMKVIDQLPKPILNKYETFKDLRKLYSVDEIKEKYFYDDELLNKYIETMEHDC